MSQSRPYARAGLVTRAYAGGIGIGSQGYLPSESAGAVICLSRIGSHGYLPGFSMTPRRTSSATVAVICEQVYRLSRLSAWLIGSHGYLPSGIQRKVEQNQFVMMSYRHVEGTFTPRP